MWDQSRAARQMRGGNHRQRHDGADHNRFSQ